jgi:6-phosphogluconolactonase/glucosamine-6-phosphate isomerase/deaminase
MNFIQSKDFTEGSNALAFYVGDLLRSGKKVLWFISGGSNIPIAVKTMSVTRSRVSRECFPNLTVMLTDERYGPTGHADSNWQQLKDSGFDFNGIKSLPVLTGLPLKETTSNYGNNVELAIDEADVIVAQFGIGADGHIAGILSDSPAINDTEGVCGYESKSFTRITLTPWTLNRINRAYVFVFGSSKKEAIVNLRGDALPVNQQPAQVLRNIPEVFIYTDQ